MPEDIKIEVVITNEIIQKAVQTALTEALESSYSNPVREAVDAELKEENGAIKTMVHEMVSNAINDPTFKDQMQKTVIEKLVLKALN